MKLGLAELGRSVRGWLGRRSSLNRVGKRLRGISSRDDR